MAYAPAGTGEYIPPPCDRTADGFHVWVPDIDLSDARPLWRCEVCGFMVDRLGVEGDTSTDEE